MFLLERDSVNGKEGKAFFLKNNEYKQLFSLKNLNSSADFQEMDFKVVGTSLIQVKTTGVKYTGTMTVYYGTRIFLDMLLEYQNTKKMPYFDIQIENDDHTSTVGKQTVVLKNCKFQKIPIAMLDADSDALQEQMGFSFTHVEVLRSFNDPESYGG